MPRRSPQHPSSRTRAAFLTAAAIACTPLAASAQDATELATGREVSGSLAPGNADFYTMELDKGTFVYGSANQLSVDVVVTVFDTDGDIVGRFDGPARGHDVFQFETDESGTYRIQVSPFEEETGEYTITIRRAEPRASTPEARVDQLMVAYDDPHTPGGAVTVLKDGEIVFSRAYGAADLTFGVPFALDTRTNIGSTSKQFTAYAIMLLEQQGELDLDDDVRQYIPELPDLGETVTIRHLMTHTSGYREFLNTLAMAGRRLDLGDGIERDELIAIVQRQPELQNSPGAEWNYNNTAFGLLATIVERISDEPFADWMADNVFHPLGMHGTFVRTSPAHLIENRAEGYSPNDDGGWQITRDLGASTGAGGIYSTMEDLARWVRNYSTGELGGSEIFETMTTPYVLTDGEETNYGFGLFIDEFRGLKRVHHGGADTAHRSMICYFPEINAAVITQSNNAGFSAGPIADSAAAAFFDEHLESVAADDTETAENEKESFDPESFDPESFDPFAGRYEMEEVPGFVLTFLREGDKLIAQATGQPQFEIAPVAANEFKIQGVDARVEFIVKDDGTTDSLILHQNGAHPANRLNDEKWDPSAEALAAYTGRYYSEELETFYTLTVTDGQLVLQHRRFDDVELTPATEHSFTGGFPVAEVAFETDANGRITSLIASNGRARGIRFERMPE